MLNATRDDIKAAYRLILGRDPDPGGFAHYAQAVAEKPVSTRQLCNILMNSGEYKSGVERGRRIDLGGVFVVVDDEEPEFGVSIARHATWEPHIIAVLQRNLRLGQVFVDVGANVGVMAFKAARAVGPSGRVIAFEPNEDNARHFLRGMLENKFQDFVRLHRFALSNRSELFSLEGISNTHLVMPDGSARLVQSVRGDDALAGEPAIHFIKIDIEGHEPFALDGLARTIQAHRPRILCEFNPRCLKDNGGIDPPAFASRIFEITRIVTVIEPNGTQREVNRPAALMAHWKACNAHAAQTGFLPDGMLHFDLLFDT